MCKYVTQGWLSPLAGGHHLPTMQVFSSSDSSDGEASSVRIGRIERPVGNSAIQMLHGSTCQMNSSPPLASTTLPDWLAHRTLDF